MFYSGSQEKKRWQGQEAFSEDLPRGWLKEVQPKLWGNELSKRLEKLLG
jgi:hypothetical protein